MRVLTRWDEEFSTKETNEILTTLALEILRDSKPDNGGQHELVAAGIASSDYSFLCNHDLTYEELPVHTAIRLRQCLAFFSKRKDIDIGVDKRATALEKFYQAEQVCKETNGIFKSWMGGRFQFDRSVERVLFGAQRKISKILGDVPSFESIRLRFGPGATTQVKKRNASARQKLSEAFACSEEFLGCLQQALEELPAWSGLAVDGPDAVLTTVEIHSAKLDFVPKNAKTERGIAVEPMLNSMFQLGYGDVISHCLLRSGVDLSDQSKNQRLALQGSLTGDLATLDLSSASDTIATELVHHLLPVDWFLVLSRLRSGTAVYGGQVLKLQKFSSMGNGFTFPLESLIFYSLAYSCCLEVLGRPPKANEISVYGDDIIVPVEVYSLLSHVLHCCGFAVNMSKSFASGPFRESCGKDFLKGIDIRPCYVKDVLSGQSLFVLHNFFVRNGHDSLACTLRSYLSPALQIFGPDEYGDGHLLGPWQLRQIHRVAKKPFPTRVAEPGDFPYVPRDWRSNDYAAGWSGGTFDTFTFKPRRSYRPLPGDCVLPSYSIYVSGSRDPMRDLEFPTKSGGFLRMQHRDLRPRQVADGSSPMSYTVDGKLGVVLPGYKGYRRVSIYTLTLG